MRMIQGVSNLSLVDVGWSSYSYTMILGIASVSGLNKPYHHNLLSQRVPSIVWTFILTIIYAWVSTSIHVVVLYSVSYNGGMLDKEDERRIEISRKYGIRPGDTLKCDVFMLFEDGYSPAEVRYLLRYFKEVYDNPKTFTDTIRRYYYQWKKDQKTDE